MKMIEGELLLPVKTDATVVQDAAVEQATLDEFMRRDPAALATSDRMDMTELLRRARSRYIKAEAQKKSKKETK